MTALVITHCAESFLQVGDWSHAGVTSATFISALLVLELLCNVLVQLQ